MDDSVTSEGCLLRINDAESDRAIVLEDDGRVAYAYLIIERETVGDVWLYNVAPAPDVIDWKDASEMPFLNPKKYCRDEETPRLHSRARVACTWSAVGAEVRIDGVLMARLELGSKPGWSRLALCAGPLAQPLDQHQ